MAVSKVVFGGSTIIDLTSDNITADKLKKGYTAHGADGDVINGTCEHDANTQDATVGESEILVGKTAYARGNKVTGKMPNNGAVSGTISEKAGKYTVPQGYHDGSGTVQISATEQAKLVPENIRDGVTILGVEGSMTGSEGVKSQSKIIKSSITNQTVLPDPGYTHLSEVLVLGIDYSESDNAAGGTTVTIG